MSESYRVTVEAAGDQGGLLDFHDAIQQAEDFFTILKGKCKNDILLNIDHIRRSNPFVVECTLYNAETLAVDHQFVQPNARAFYRLYMDIYVGRIWDPDLPHFLRDPVKKILQRNTSGIGRTIFALPHTENPIEIEVRPDQAKLGLKMLNTTHHPDNPSIWANRTELGSIEGPIVSVGTYYGKPALKILMTSLDQQIWCCLSDDEYSKWKSKITASHA